MTIGERFKNKAQRGICGSAGVAQPGQSARLIGPLPFGGAWETGRSRVQSPPPAPFTIFLGVLMLLTNHARERIIKRLSKSRRHERIYSVLLDFLKGAEKIEVSDRIVIFTDKRKSLVCSRLECRKLNTAEIIKEVKNTEETYECVFWGDKKVAKKTTPKKFLNEIPNGNFYFYINREKKVIYVGEEEPLLAITFRPAKRKERGYAGTMNISPKGSS